MKNIIIITLCGCILTSCASITTGKNQSLIVATAPELHASCELTNDKGVWYVNETPASVTVSRAYGDLNVICRKGEKSGNTKVKSSTKGMVFGNILAGGIICAVVDERTGAAYDYPSTITVPMK